MDKNDNFIIKTDHENGNSSCKAMGKTPLVYDMYKQNVYYFQVKIEKDNDKDERTMPGDKPKIASGIKMSIGFCRDNFDLNKNSIVENKKKDFFVIDLFDGETYCSQFPGIFNDYIPKTKALVEGDILGV